MSTLKKFAIRYNAVAAILVIFMLFFMMNNMHFKSQLEHQSPQGFLAQDAYWMLPYIDHLLETGRYTHEPNTTTGFYSGKVTLIEPPLLTYTFGAFTLLTGLSSHDASILGLFILLSGLVLIIYYLLNNVHPLLPYFSLPVLLFQGIFPFSAGISWGFWKFYLTFIILVTATTIFVLTERGYVNSIFLGFLLFAMILGHLSLALYFCVALCINFIWESVLRRNVGVKRILYYALIGLVALFLSANYIIDFYAQYAGNSLVGTVLQEGYSLYGATPYLKHMLPFIIVGFAGVILYFFSKLQKNLIMFLFFFILLFGPLFHYDRLYQYRLFMPVIVSLFFGLGMLFLSNMLGEKKVIIIALVTFFILTASLSYPQIKSLRGLEGTYSIFPDSYWEGITYLNAAPGKSVLVIDPTLTQRAVLLNIEKYTRYLDMENSLRNDSVINSTKQYCSNPGLLRTGFIHLEESTELDLHCSSKAIPLCFYDYAFLNLQITNEVQKQWLTQVSSSFVNWSLVYQKDNVVIVQNKEVCSHEA